MELSKIMTIFTHNHMFLLYRFCIGKFLFLVHRLGRSGRGHCNRIDVKPVGVSINNFVKEDQEAAA